MSGATILGRRPRPPRSPVKETAGRQADGGAPRPSPCCPAKNRRAARPGLLTAGAIRRHPATASSACSPRRPPRPSMARASVLRRHGRRAPATCFSGTARSPSRRHAVTKGLARRGQVVPLLAGRSTKLTPGWKRITRVTPGAGRCRPNRAPRPPLRRTMLFGDGSTLLDRIFARSAGFAVRGGLAALIPGLQGAAARLPSPASIGGELTAARAAGVASSYPRLRLVAARGQLMQQLPTGRAR